MKGLMKLRSLGLRMRMALSERYPARKRAVQFVNPYGKPRDDVAPEQPAAYNWKFIERGIHPDQTPYLKFTSGSMMALVHLLLHPEEFILNFSIKDGPMAIELRGEPSDLAGKVRVSIDYVEYDGEHEHPQTLFLIDLEPRDLQHPDFWGELMRRFRIVAQDLFDERVLNHQGVRDFWDQGLAHILENP